MVWTCGGPLRSKIATSAGKVTSRARCSQSVILSRHMITFCRCRRVKSWLIAPGGGCGVERVRGGRCGQLGGAVVVETNERALERRVLVPAVDCLDRFAACSRRGTAEPRSGPRASPPSRRSPRSGRGLSGASRSPASGSSGDAGRSKSSTASPASPPDAPMPQPCCAASAPRAPPGSRYPPQRHPAPAAGTRHPVLPRSRRDPPSRPRTRQEACRPYHG